ncbi:MAG TPA: 50S ribosomal protein L22 [Fimbriimonadaceae bacterium]|nr:50S ribosomal protein L22 [Fimbriimonadaceae bacterium]HRJ97271.1 50S ribosomal protein L22 [Fimbriimonadaceae bacterium]
MEVRAVAKFVRVQPRKVRLVAAEVRGEPAVMSAHKLRFHPSKGAFVLRKVLVSAISNAIENNGAIAENLRIARIEVDEGPRLKRIEQRAMGRGNRIVKRMSHITVVVEDYEPAAKVKPHGTKAKARPKFEAPKKGKKQAEKADAAAAVEPEATETTVATEPATIETPEVEPVETIEVVEATDTTPEPEVGTAAVTEEPSMVESSEQTTLEATGLTDVDEAIAEIEGAPGNQPEDKKD